MARRGVPFEFKQVDRALLWDRLLLQLSQVAELTGLDRRRLGYWVAKGYLVPAIRNPDRFDAAAAEKVLLIRQALSAGIPLRRALKLHEELAAQSRRYSRSGDTSSEEVGGLRDQLAGARAALETALAALEPYSAGAPEMRQVAEPPPAQTRVENGSPLEKSQPR